MNRTERRAARAAFDRYQAAANPPAALVHELLSAVAAMVAADTARRVRFIADDYVVVHSAHRQAQR